MVAGIRGLPGAPSARASLFGPRSAAEARLLDKAAGFGRDLTYEDCTHERLAAIARRDGVDLATAILFDRIRRAAPNAALIRSLESATFDGRTDFVRGRLLIVPALFYRERPEIGGDGAAVMQAATAAGLNVELMPVKSGATARENAKLLRNLIPERTSDPTVIVSLSKGCADLRLAFDEMPVPAGLRAWVLVSGLLRPTPAIDRLQSRWWSRAILAMLIKRQGAGADLIHEFSTGTGSPLERPAVAPAGLPVINLIGCPLSCHLGTPFGRLRHRQMSSRGPNDGLTLLRDAILEPGAVYPVWGADHYFRLPAISRLLTRLIGHLAALGCFRPSPPEAVQHLTGGLDEECRNPHPDPRRAPLPLARSVAPARADGGSRPRPAQGDARRPA